MIVGDAIQTAWRATVRHALIDVLVLCGVAITPAAAQQPHGVPPGLAKKSLKPAAGPGGSVSGPGAVGGELLPGPNVRSFGVWLDDATVLGPHEAWLTVSVQRWASPTLRGFDVPVSGISMG